MYVAERRMTCLDKAAQSIEEEFGHFDLVPLDEAMRVDLLDRVDTKLAVTLDQLVAILRLLRETNPGTYRLVCTGTGAAPTYSTLYFDTPELDCYRDHHNGRRVRHKVRYRHYHSTDSVFFEVKQRSNPGRTAKTRIQVPAIPDRLGPAEWELTRELGIPASTLVPTLYVVYRRITLLGYRQRVTIDLAMKCAARNQAGTDMSSWAVVELKDGLRNPDSGMAQVFRLMGLRPHSMSKYCLGVASCFPEVKQNRFKSRLKKMELV